MPAQTTANLVIYLEETNGCITAVSTIVSKKVVAGLLTMTMAHGAYPSGCEVGKLAHTIAVSGEVSSSSVSLAAMAIERLPTNSDPS